MRKTFLILFLLLSFTYAADIFYCSGDQKIYLYPYDNQLRSEPHIIYFKDEKGRSMGVADRLIVKLKDDKTIDALLLKYKLTLEKKLGQNLFVLKVSNKSLTIETANRLNEDIDVLYSQPDFIKQTINR